MLEKTSYDYLCTLTNTMQELAERQVEFAEFVRSRLQTLLGQDHHWGWDLEDITHVSPIGLEDIDQRWRAFFEPYRQLMVVHGHDDLLAFPALRNVFPFGVIDGSIAIGGYLGMREIYAQTYAQGAQDVPFHAYLQSIGFHP